MKKKVIGIPGYKGAKEECFGAGVNHLQFINHFGNARIIMPWEKYVKVDMLYLPGGLDTQPARYGQTPGFSTSNQDVYKEFFLEERLPLYMEHDTPTFGVCLGMQMLAVYFGCRLTQDLLFHPTSTERWKEAHKVLPVPLTGVRFEGRRYSTFDVNSHHHQALCESGMSANITPLFTATNDDDYITGDGDIIEAFASTEKPVFGVQWHPEEWYDGFSIAVVKYLLSLSDTKIVKENEEEIGLPAVI